MYLFNNIFKGMLTSVLGALVEKFKVEILFWE